MTYNPEAQQYADIDLDCDSEFNEKDLIIAELLEALENLQKELHANRKMNVKKDFGLMVADAHANRAIYKAKGGGDR
jgi:hypothetical protein